MSDSPPGGGWEDPPAADGTAPPTRAPEMEPGDLLPVQPSAGGRERGEALRGQGTLLHMARAPLTVSRRWPARLRHRGPGNGSARELRAPEGPSCGFRHPGSRSISRSRRWFRFPRSGGIRGPGVQMGPASRPGDALWTPGHPWGGGWGPPVSAVRNPVPCAPAALASDPRSPRPRGAPARPSSSGSLRPRVPGPRGARAPPAAAR